MSARKAMAWTGLLLLWIGLDQLASVRSESPTEMEINFNMSLRNIPPDLPANITKLSLSHNAIEISESDILTLQRYSRLTELHLDHNNLTILPGHTFDRLSQLKILNVSSNNIGRVELRAFAGLANLTELDLSHNAIVSLPPRVFANLSKLESVYLQGNRMQFLENSTLEDLKDLKHLDLDGNPWNCSGTLLWALNCLNDMKNKIGQGPVCASPEAESGRSILNSSAVPECFPEFQNTSTPTDTVPARATSEQTTHTMSTGHTSTRDHTASNKATPTQTTPAKSNGHTSTRDHTASNKATPTQTRHTAINGHTCSRTSTIQDHSDSKKGSAPTVQGDSRLPFLVGVVAVAALGSFIFILRLVRPQCHNHLSLYRHHRLRQEESDLFSTRCHANFSFEGEEMETRSQELDMSLDKEDEEDEEDVEEEEEDGYIEDGYIEGRIYREQTEG